MSKQMATPARTLRPPVLALPTSKTESVVPGVYSRPIRSMRSGANCRQNQRSGTYSPNGTLAVVPEHRRVEVVIDLVAGGVGRTGVARRDDAGNQRSIGGPRDGIER